MAYEYLKKLVLAKDALKLACEYIADQSGECPSERGVDMEQMCGIVCQRDCVDDSICWAQYFVAKAQAIEKEACHD